MPKAKRNIIAIDCETDPFKFGRIPEPFLWGAYNGNEFITFDDTSEFVGWLANRKCYAFAHNGGKFDFMYLLKYVRQTRARIIHGRVVEFQIGSAILRDSYSAMPGALEAIAGKTNIDYWKFEKEIRHEHMAEIKRYLRDDCDYLYNLMVRYFATAGTSATIATNALRFARGLGITIRKTHHRFDTRYRPFYFGGRTECFAVGNIQNINVYDIKSQYPYAMSHDMPHGNEVSNGKSIKGFTESELQRGFFHVTCRSFGAFPLKEKQLLRFPYGVHEFFVTGWEFIKAQQLGLITDVTIHSFRAFSDTINLSPYCEHWFEQKMIAERKGDKVEREIAKRMLNSLYGKFAQNPIEYNDYKIVQRNTPVDWDDGWELGPEEWGAEIHQRPVLWRYQKRWGDEWNKFPIHYNVATAASITGFARAMLMDGIAKVGFDNIVYCDTDSIFVRAGAPVHKLRQNGEIGAWEWEGFADHCHIAGRKLYAMKMTNGPKSGETKLASKGARLTHDQIALIAAGEKIVYKREAPSFSLANGAHFVVRTIQATGKPEIPVYK